MSSRKAVGVFDSGLGGLTVVKEIKNSYPNSTVIYLGDTARVPYGTRSKRVVEEFAVQDAKFLENLGVGLVVIACSTASSLATEAVKRAVNVPVYEVISAGATASVEATKRGRVGILGTRATVGSHAYANWIKRLNPDVVSFELACPLLVPLIEEGETEGKIIELVLSRYLKEVGQWHVDTLILGCTHYPILEDLINQHLGGGVVLINPGKELVKRMPVLEKGGRDRYFVTDMTDRFINTAEMFLGYDIGDKIDLVRL